MQACAQGHSYFEKDLRGTNNALLKVFGIELDWSQELKTGRRTPADL